VILRPEQFETWLGGEETELEAASQLLKPAPDDFLQAEEMDPRINNSKIDEPGIQQPVQPALL
jgi:putative SOS response-associated peptidase YedK